MQAKGNVVPSSLWQYCASLTSAHTSVIPTDGHHTYVGYRVPSFILILGKTVMIVIVT